MKPERVLIPLVAVVVAVFATSRVMESVDPGPLRAQSTSGKGGGDHGDGGNGRGDHHERRSHETYSFFSPAGMRQLTGLLRREGGPEGQITLFRVQAGEAQVFLKKGGGSGGLLVVERGAKVKFRTESPVSPPGGFGISKLDPRAPQRIGDAIARLSKASLADVDYMVFLINPIENVGSWEAFLSNADHTHFHADAHGRHVTRP